MKDDEIIAVVQAHKEGKTIQARVLQSSPSYVPSLDGVWMVLNVGVWDFANCEYRVAPEPRKPREWIVCVDANRHLQCQGNGFYGDNYFKVREVMDDIEEIKEAFRKAVDGI